MSHNFKDWVQRLPGERDIVSRTIFFFLFEKEGSLLASASIDAHNLTIIEVSNTVHISKFTSHKNNKLGKITTVLAYYWHAT